MRATVLFPVLLGACAASPADLPGDDLEGETPDGGKGDAPGEPAGLVHCAGRAFTAPEPTGFDSWTGDVSSAAGDPRHFAQDVIAVPGATARVDAKLAYGAIWKDLEQERAELYIDDCAGWQHVGNATSDDDGHAVFDVAADLAPGLHELRILVPGDATEAAAALWILPRGTHVVVSDIDGTLTTSDGELFEQILDGSHVPEAYDAAQDLTAAHDALGHVVVYLTGRPYWLLGITRDWLAGEGFVPGPVHVTDTNADILPTEGSVGEYKRAWLDGLEEAGYVIDVAYGNATTDIYAYLNAGLSPDDVWIIGDNAGAEGTHATLASWDTRAREVAAGEPVDQPF